MEGGERLWLGSASDAESAGRDFYQSTERKVARAQAASAPRAAEGVMAE
jgi:hypothetical protein